ncbi:MAG: NAD(P)-binding domain-containing protein [Prevotellaceae bacterium]|jgi:shikimate dehydrogenase|nr:NAD(P)-binding domain-containing protein [Prevotellaceae bacterium]
MKLFAITGNPVLHSKSPDLFAAAYPLRADEFAYFRLAAESAEEVALLFDELGLSGMNVTAPFKGDMAKLADVRAPEVQTLNACNTLALENGKKCSYNTDIFGVLGSLEKSGVSVAGKRCLTLGAGGAGSAAAYALHTAGGAVTIANRTVDKARRLAESIGCSYAGLDEVAAIAPQADVIVSTLYQHVDVLDEAWLKPQHVVFDAIYHGSALQEKARRAGCKFINGAGWLLHQGAPAYRRFTGVEPDVENMQKAVLPQALPKHISLIGFMGAGKSAVAPALARLLGMAVTDADAVLEKRCGASIPQLIGEKGEAYFREQERIVLEEALASATPTVISCGGGAVTQPHISKLLKEHSIVVWIYAPPACCLSRIDVSTRPLLASHADPQQAAAELFEKRKFLYAKTAWMLVSSHCRSEAQVSRLIYDEISKVLHR